MSDLSATNCGCGCDSGCGNNCTGGNSLFGNGNCGCSIIWIILLLSICGGNSWGQSGCGCEGNNNCLLLILLLLFCNNDFCGC